MKRRSWSSSNLCLLPKTYFTRLVMFVTTLTIVAFVCVEFGFKMGRGYLRITTGDIAGQERLSMKEPNASDVSFAVGNIESTNGDSTQFLRSLFHEDEPECWDQPFLLILVVSAPENFARRAAIRRSWAPVAPILFLLGSSSNKFLTVLTRNEQASSRDTLIGPYLDTYRNLTLKVLHGFRWALEHCSPHYLLKTDDDCFVNVSLLIKFLRHHNTARTGLYIGNVRWTSSVVRDPKSPWFVSPEDYPGPRYPPYVRGAGYVLSLDMLRILVSANTSPFPNEDAFVGVVLSKRGVIATPSDRFVLAGNWHMCNFAYLLVVHGIRVDEQRVMRKMAENAAQECHIQTEWFRPDSKI